MKERIINTEETYLRLIEEEYNNRSTRTIKSTFHEDLANFKNDFELKVKQFVLEETREQQDLRIDIITSAELKIGIDSGYDGTALYLQSDKYKSGELYIISQGSQDIKDWEYNAKSMLAGLNINQAKSANHFINVVKEHLNISKHVPVIGLSHSLAHNNNLTTHLLYDTFDEIYSVNGAQTNYYQLFLEDRQFTQRVIKEFSLPTSDTLAIYDLDPSELHDFAQEFYNDKIPVVNQRISTDDPLYALNTARGFFQLGNVEYIDTNPDYPGLHSIMKKLPDDIVHCYGLWHSL